MSDEDDVPGQMQLFADPPSPVRQAQGRPAATMEASPKRRRRRLPSIDKRPGLCLGCGENVEQCTCEENQMRRQGAKDAKKMQATRPIGEPTDLVKRELVTLRNCCCGARIGFEMLLHNRQSLSDADLREIITRLRNVEDRTTITIRRMEGREDDGSTGY